MATANFSTTDISTIYAIDIEDDFTWEDTIEKMRKVLSDKYDIDFCEGVDSDEIGIITHSLPWMEVSFEVKLKSGYYSGANFDVEVTWQDHFGQFMGDIAILDDSGRYPSHWIMQSIADALWNMSAYSSKGMCSLQAPNQIKAVRKLIDEKLPELEAILAKHSDHNLRVAGVFSNGEAVYESIK